MWKNPRESGLKRDLLVLPDPFFSAARCTAGSSYRSAIDAPQFAVDVAIGRLQSMQDFVQRAVRIPFIKQVPHRASLPKLFRQIAPWRAGTFNPQNSIHDIAPVDRWPSGGRGRGKNVLDLIPLFIRETMSSHCMSSVTSGLRSKTKFDANPTRNGRPVF